MRKTGVRELILEAGLSALVERGFNGVGVQEITAAAGVPKGSFYNHFESKEALGAAIVERFAETSAARRAILTDAAIPGLERLRGHFEALNAAFAQADYKRGCLLGNFSAELANQSPLIRQTLGDLFSRWTADLEGAVAAAQAEGAVSQQASARDLAAFLLDAYEGALLRSRVERTGEPFERFMTIAFQRLLA